MRWKIEKQHGQGSRRLSKGIKMRVGSGDKKSTIGVKDLHLVPTSSKCEKLVG